jgi:hypothetical protein
MTTTDHPRAESASPGLPTAAAGVASDRDPGAGPVPRRPYRALLLAAGCYLTLSMVLWWNVWSSHPTSTTTCGCGDTSLFTWFLAWPAYAFSHGLNPLYSTAMFHPTGVNLLANTGVVGVGVVLAPVTWLFGPVATLNVALTLSPVLSALAMFVLLRRWVRWVPAAFFGGLLYGFSPFVLITLTDAHLMLGLAVIPPLVVACLDEMLIRQRHRSIVSGVALGLLVTVQFFIGTEVLAIMVIAGAMGVLLVILYGVWHRDALRRRAGHAGLALVAATVTAAVLLAYPLWFALAGPAHLSGPVWGPGTVLSYGGTNLKDYLLPAPAYAATTALGKSIGGYQGPTLSAQYLGIGLVVVLLVGALLWRRDRRLWLFGAIGLVSVPLSFGLQFHHWTAWRLFVRFPLMENVIPSRFLIVTYLAAGVLLGLVVDHIYLETGRRRVATPGTGAGPSPGGRSMRVRSSSASVVAVVVAAIALLPIIGYYAGGIPLAARPVVVPTWFRTVAPHLARGQVILVFPVPFAFRQSAMTWQAVEGMPYSMVGGGGPNSIPFRAGSERLGQIYISNLSMSASDQSITSDEITAVRQALDGWGVTMVVIADPSPLPIYERVHLVRTAALLMTSVTGQRPTHSAEAWVWSGLNHAGPAIQPSAGTLSRCGVGPAVGSTASINRATACVLAGASAP